MRIRTTLAVLTFALLATVRAPAEPPPGDDPIGRLLFPPDKVLNHAQEIGLDDAQRKGIRAELQKTQPKFLEFQLDLQAEVEKMTQLLQEKPVDEAKVMTQLDRVLALEKNAKKTQIALLVRIRNLLTPDQQAKMSVLQKGEGK
ncbi:MAG: periplasmic heavy metal sensor [Thermoanaerobaculia bacterium]|nr:periplasmic heavy metal sensor [Thermoanaerobaculia bacterium]